MDTGAQPQPKKKFRAGLYWRIGSQTRFWGWGEPPASQVERPWASLADWLRMAHSPSFFQHSSVTAGDGPTVEASETPPSPEQLALSGNRAPERRVGFIWGRRFIGFVIR